MSSDLPAPRPKILEIESYVPGESYVQGGIEPIKLSSNETPLGPSPDAIKAYQNAAYNLSRYPDGEAKHLKEAISTKYNLNPNSIICGAGSDDLLSLIAHAFIGPDNEGLYTQYGFLLYKIVILASGGNPVVASEINYRADVDKILEKISYRTKVVFLANPNNPTGTYLSHKEVNRLRRELPSHVVLVLDGAYAEYVLERDYDAGIELVTNTNNTIMTRTFSKIYGLAGLRVGWAYCSKGIAPILNRIRGPFNVSTPSILAAAAAIKDQSHLSSAIAHNEKWLSWMKSEIEKLGLVVTPSVANFLLVHFPLLQKRNAVLCDEFLRSHGIIVRGVGSYGLPHCLRITIGKEDENRKLIAVMGEFQKRMTDTKDGLS
ncbi:MAG: histidinol-phosphate transaminase [Hyphomicrobium sp.]